jgi:hypothetical protein
LCGYTAEWGSRYISKNKDIVNLDGAFEPFYANLKKEFKDSYEAEKKSFGPRD